MASVQERRGDPGRYQKRQERHDDEGLQWKAEGRRNRFPGQIRSLTRQQQEVISAPSWLKLRAEFAAFPDAPARATQTRHGATIKAGMCSKHMVLAIPA